MATKKIQMQERRGILLVPPLGLSSHGAFPAYFAFPRANGEGGRGTEKKHANSKPRPQAVRAARR